MSKLLTFLACFLLVGCAGLFGPPPVEVPKRVRTLGILPVLIDSESIDYSNREGLIAVLEETSQDVDDWLIEELREKGDYFDVRKIEGASAQLFSQVIASRSVVAEGAATRYEYAFNPAGITELVEGQLVDAVLVVVINGVKRSEKRWSPNSTRLEYLTSEYSSLLYSAAIIAAPAEQLWARNISPGDFFLRLDYADFSEAFWNLTDAVRIKEISLPGLHRSLTEPETGLFIKRTTAKKYNQMVRELVDQLKSGM